jgi:hypothetical protein
MSNPSSAQNFNTELVKCIEDLRDKREELNRVIIKVCDLHVPTFTFFIRKRRIR